MSWVTDFSRFGHRIFIAFIELKIDGSWNKHTEMMGDFRSTPYEVLSANSENCLVHIIEPDGLRRILQFTEGATISIRQNIFSYHQKQANEITVDEKEQSGKGKTRDTL